MKLFKLDRDFIKVELLVKAMRHVCRPGGEDSMRDMGLKVSFKVILLSLTLLMIIPFERRADGSGGITFEQYKNAEIRSLPHGFVEQ